MKNHVFYVNPAKLQHIGYQIINVINFELC